MKATKSTIEVTPEDLANELFLQQKQHGSCSAAVSRLIWDTIRRRYPKRNFDKVFGVVEEGSWHQRDLLYWREREDFLRKNFPLRFQKKWIQYSPGYADLPDSLILV